MKGTLLTVLLLLLAFGALVLFPSPLWFDTQYAAGYTHRAFKSVKIGDTEQEVFSGLGAAFSTNDCEPYVQWVYSADPQRGFSQHGEASGTYTMVRFENGLVKRINGVTASRSSLVSYTMTLGPGAGYLQLTSQEIENLEGVTPDKAKEKLGAPLAVYEFKASRLLWYSRSPSGGSYRLKLIGLDPAGKVVHVDASNYWD